jgi:hypothetical protein
MLSTCRRVVTEDGFFYYFMTYRFCGQPAAAPPVRWRGYGSRYFTKYQFSGLMLSVGLCGLTPWRLLATSVSW